MRNVTPSSVNAVVLTYCGASSRLSAHSGSAAISAPTRFMTSIARPTSDSPIPTTSTTALA